MRRARFLAVLMSAALACATESQPPAPPVDVATPDSTAKAVVVGRAAPGAIISLESESTRALPPPSEPAGMDQFSREFHPRLLLMQAGQPVEFSNSENELHSVRVIAEDQSQRMTVYNVVVAPLSAQRHVLDKPGLYEVRCDLHTDMQAFIYAAPTPHVITAGGDGRFTFEAVEPGAYTLTVLSQGQSSQRPIAVALPRTEIGGLTQN